MQIHKLDTLLGLLILLIAAEWLNQIVGSWDWDVDHFMYFGQRLLAGQFHWTLEFDDKLPVLQFLFALPAAFDSLAVWRGMSLTFQALGAVSLGFVVNDVLERHSDLAQSERQRHAALAGLVFLGFNAWFPGGIHQINATAASMSAMALAAAVLSLRRTGRLRLLFLLFSAFAASIGIGIRPYLLFPLIAAIGWIFLREANGVARAVGRTATWIACVGLFGLVVNALPYLLIGQVDAFEAGMSMLSQTLNPQSKANIVLWLLRSFDSAPEPVFMLVMLALAACVFSVVALAGRRAEVLALYYDTLVFALLVPALLLLSIFSRHFWPHYLQMFSPFLTIGVAMFFVFARPAVTTVTSRVLLALLVALGLVLALPNAALDLLRYARSDGDSARAQLARAAAMVLEQEPEDRRDFLFVDDMYVHWILNEPRHGFPHAANSLHIITRGWWRDVEMPGHFDHPTDAGAYCRALIEHGPSVVFIRQRTSGFADACLQPNPRYVRITGPGSEQFAVFRRLH